jgi:predicted GNAT family N-acyltransferase
VRKIEYKTITDKNEILDVFKTIVKDSKMKHTYALRNYLTKRAKSEAAFVITANENEKLIGYAFPEESVHPNISYLSYIFVKEEHRRTENVGKNIIKEFCKTAKNNKSDTLTFWAFEEALPFYEKLGFKSPNNDTYFFLKIDDALKIIEKSKKDKKIRPIQPRKSPKPTELFCYGK